MATSNLLNLCCQIEVSGVRCKAGKNENLAFEYCRQDTRLEEWIDIVAAALSPVVTRDKVTVTQTESG